MRKTILALGCAVAASICATARAQDYGNGPNTYYLHRGSSFQHGCWGACACPLSARETMRGTFTLSLISVGNVTDFYSVSNVQWTVPRLAGQPFNEVLNGNGNFSAGQVPFATHQHISLDVNLGTPFPPYAAAQHFETTLAASTRSVAPPAIDIELENSTTGCPGIRLRVVASWYLSDWNSDGVRSVQDIFAFLADYFQGNADYNADNQTTIQDIFSFLADWFAGV